MSATTRWFRRGDHLVMLGASAGAFVLLALSTLTGWPVGAGGAGSPATTAVNPVMAAQAGDCLNWTKQDLSDVEKVDCAAQHLFEVTGVADISAAHGPQAPFPDDEQWQQISQEQCAKTSLDYLGGKFDPYGKYTVGPLNPGERLWAEGRRTLRCGLQVAGPAGGLLPSYGTARAQDQSDVYDPGVCLGITATGSVADPIDCAKPHTFEITGVVPMPPGEFPVPDQQDELMFTECAKLTTEYTGGADLKARGLIVTWDTRVPQSWAAGSRLANCKVGATPVDGVLIAWEGSVRNPDAPPLTTSNPPQTTAVQQDEPTGAPLHSQSNSSSAAPPSSGSKPPKSDETTTTATTTTTSR
ncbi:septum formation family protein [Saccharothrix sp. 6-C]|uniref:septum formation family protein n=1 Tax=Saccharothrix sp. 6-C TaxID=2781735 RepID=UPI001F429CC3|nr:septum formation family protein [Saccharothrix sp. 6-C]